ncbi:hypothetical protein MMC20_005293, partial [Loxospora ochrophaea]|nr:hypothetical protein [Loxospora ochrophaea]
MADLLSSLIVPDSDQESFHSAHSQNHPAIASPTLSESTMATTKRLSAEDEYPVHDFQTFLNNPANQTLLESSKKKKSSTQSQNPLNYGANVQPVRLGGGHSSVSISTLYQLCQARGLTPEFQIDGSNTSFNGRLILGPDQVIEENNYWTTKKEVKQALAKKGIKVVESIDAPSAHSTTDSNPTENWIGKLMEFSTIATPTQPPFFTDFALGSSFACECSLPSYRPTAPFGNRSKPFPNKKAAKTNAAREAVSWLIQQGHLEPDGSIKRKKLKMGAGPVTAGPVGEGKKVESGRAGGGESTGAEKSWAQKVNDYAPHLGLSPPKYDLTASSPSTPNLLSGGASFPNDPTIQHPGPIGE